MSRSTTRGAHTFAGSLEAPMSTATRVLVVRHGQSTWNAHGRWQGHADPPLSHFGRAQARAAAQAVGPVDAVIASDLDRAVESATIIAGELGFDGVTVEERFRERDAGEWTGKTRHEIELEWPGYLEHGRFPPNFESRRHVQERVSAALADLHRNLPGRSLL